MDQAQRNWGLLRLASLHVVLTVLAIAVRLVLSVIGAAAAAIIVTFTVMLSLFTWAGMANPPHMNELFVALLVLFEITVIWYFLRRLKERRTAGVPA